jgi:hypothetical protein
VLEQLVADPGLAGNDYERSKIEAERLVATCSWLPSYIIHRPSIVIGDSRTGYTSTFHGFYAPLQIGAQFAKQFGFASQAGDWFRQQLGILETDSKNLVPVDWVGESIVELATQQTLSPGTILHWTHSQPVSCAEMQRAIVDAIEAYSRSSSRESEFETAFPFLQAFREQMGVYESYFGNDPTFDTTNATRYASYLPCPRVDYRSLRNTAEFALRTQFGWPKPQLQDLPHAELRTAMYRQPVGGVLRSRGDDARVLQVRTLGPGAVETLTFKQLAGGWSPVDSPVAGVPPTLVISMDRLADCIFGTTGIEDLIASGTATILGCPRQDNVRLVANWLKDVQSKTQP